MRALTILQLQWAYAQWYYYGYQWKEIAAKLHISRQTLTANLDKLGFDRSKRADIGNYEQAIISWMPDEKFDVISDYLQYVYERKSDYDISNGWAMSDLIELSVDYTKEKNYEKRNEKLLENLEYVQRKQWIRLGK